VVDEFRLMYPLIRILKMVPELPTVSKTLLGNQGFFMLRQSESEKKTAPEGQDCSMTTTRPKG
jgi:hypothetical protein